jgi:glycosyltransferase involved in cell wall biosynthesis
MKISIITVCYKSAATIEKTLQLIKNQSYQNLEYIVVDGGSSDDTLKIIKNYSSCITNYISESDKGLYDAMNKGIIVASGDVIGILNSDDLYQEYYKQTYN